MENGKSLCSGWCSSCSSPDHHQWLLSTLSELDKSISAMLSLMQKEDGETYYQKKAQLQKKVQDFHKSYHSLADYYGQFSSPASPLPPISLGHRFCIEWNGDTNVEPLDMNCESRTHVKLENFLTDGNSLEDYQSTVREAAEKMKQRNDDLESGFHIASACKMAGSLEQQISISEQMSRLAEGVLGELARRNNEKREANKMLQRKVDKMMEEGRVLSLEYDRLADENRALRLKLNSPTEDGKTLQRCPTSYSISKKQRRSHFSWFKCLLQ